MAVYAGVGVLSAVLGQGAVAAQATEESGLPDIVVTAERRPDSAQSIGVALSVLSGQELAQRGVTSVNQLQYQTPGLEAVPAFGGGQPNFRLRGVGFDDYASNNASPVGIYVDEVAKPFPIQTQGMLFDLDRVEVLRGPQGTLYGRNTTGGAISFTTARPTQQTSAGIDMDYGSFGLFHTEGFVSGGLGSGLAVRLSAATEQGGGFQHDRATGRSLGDADRVGVRGQIAYDHDALSLLVEGHYGRDTSDATGLYLFQPLGTIPADPSNGRVTGWGGSSQFAAVTGIGTDAKPFRDNTTAGGHVTAALDLGPAKLTSVTAYEQFRRREYNDWDASALAYAGTYFNSRARTFSQEVRLASTAAGGTRWIVGAYYADERLRDHFDSDFMQSLGFVALTSYRQRARTIAGFGQLDYAVTSRLTLTGGLRVEHERRLLDDFTTSTAPATGIGVGSGASRLAYTRVSGKAAAEYRVTDTSLLYASASRGVKSGGFTAYNTLTPSQLAPFRPETLYAYEIGSKNQFAGNRLRLNGAAFYYDYRNQQVQSAIYDPVYGAVGKIVNAPRSHIYGIEGELDWTPLPGLTISQGVAWRKGKFDRFQDLDITASTTAGATRTVSRAGQDEGFPHWSYNGSASYRMPLDRFDLTAQADYAYHGPQDPVLLGPVFRVADYWLVNGTLTFGPRGGPWSIGVYARNLLDQHYDLTRNFFLSGVDIAAPGRPRSFGVRAKYRL
ncbi:TonB-dependent receptor [Sphingomonas nostoxanthinifaciens]|uniref:TonB-dependent receptor n=1 Tax=Sphingomonas nostoxanthinifaciens TaxID=2872652 RepID=UPI001CC2040D|nr:TonB-dependent receptor [Sphingomonas nostoxanthinifaciens]UAK23469.1 TonB-dependent receptor [Sphingomonas nostoxanthinifaciens]